MISLVFHPSLPLHSNSSYCGGIEFDSPGIWKIIFQNPLILGLYIRRQWHSDNKTRISLTNLTQLSNSMPTFLEILGG